MFLYLPSLWFSAVSGLPRACAVPVALHAPHGCMQRCSGRVQRMLHSIKKRDAEDAGERKHSRAMSYEDMQKLYAHAKSDCPSRECAEQFVHHGNGHYHPLSPNLLSKRAEHLYFLAYSSLSFSLWTRYVCFDIPITQS